MGKDGADTYQSKNAPLLDSIGFDSLLGMITGQPIKPSPGLDTAYIAQNLGGVYNKADNSITMPDKSVIKYDPLTNSFNQLQGGPSKQASDIAEMEANLNNFKNSRVGHQPQGVAQIAEMQAEIDKAKQGLNTSAGNNAGTYAGRANDILKSNVNKNIYGENSPYNLFGSQSFGAKTYDPATGTMVDANQGGPATGLPGQFGVNEAYGTSDNAGQRQSGGPQQLTADYYLQKYGDYLNDPYQQYQYQSMPDYNQYQYQGFQPYQQYDYSLGQIPTVNNVDQALVDKIQSQALDQVNQGYRAGTQNIQDTIAQSGGSLGGGRALGLMNQLEQDTQRQRQQQSDQIQMDQAMRGFYDAQNVRNMQAARDEAVSVRQGAEARYGYDTGLNQNAAKNQTAQQENQKAYDTAATQNAAKNQTAQQENQTAFNVGQEQGQNRLGIAASANNEQANRSASELQANRQQQLAKIQALQDFLRIYAQQDATAGQLAAANANNITSTLGSIVGGAAKIGAAKIAG